MFGREFLAEHRAMLMAATLLVATLVAITWLWPDIFRSGGFLGSDKDNSEAAKDEIRRQLAESMQQGVMMNEKAKAGVRTQLENTADTSPGESEKEKIRAQVQVQ